jgi:hypothetical protein
MFGNGCAMRGFRAAVKNSAVDLWMESLDATVEHFGEPGELRDIFDGDAGIAKQFGSSASGDELDVHRCELASEFDETGFVGDTEESALDTGHEGLEGSGKF